MTSEPQPETFVPLRRAASRLGVPAAWLQAEALEGKLPHLRVGRRLLFCIPRLKSKLIERSERDPHPSAEALDSTSDPGGSDVAE